MVGVVGVVGVVGRAESMIGSGVDVMDDLHVATIEALPPDQPVVMLNLMRFREQSLDGDGTGWDAYVRYSRMTNKLIKERSGRIEWAGEVQGTTFGPEAHGRWDYAALVRYPTAAAFLDMMQSGEYQQANVHRHNGCDAHLIMAINELFNGLAGPSPSS